MSDQAQQELQIKLAFLDRHIEEQDKVIHDLRSELDRLTHRLERLEERLNSSSTGDESLPHERPPHY